MQSAKKLAEDWKKQKNEEKEQQEIDIGVKELEQSWASCSHTHKKMFLQQMMVLCCNSLSISNRGI